MKTTKILSAVSAAALLGISSVALAQGTARQPSPGSSGGAPAGSTMQRQDAPSSGSTGHRCQKATRSSKDWHVQVEPGAAGQGNGQGRPEVQAQDRHAEARQQVADEPGRRQGGAKSGSTVGAAPAGAVNLTTEQRTTIRQDVLTSNAPRATNINFSINVGTVVPSSVRVVEVPETIIKIRPAWKGYRYFVYNDEIIIVEPRTLKIVAVLDV